MNEFVRGKVRQLSTEIKVIRRDGRIEDHGVVSFWHRNPLKRLWWRLGQNFRENFQRRPK